MATIIVGLHVSVCILLILIVLLQSGKGAEMGASIGGGGSQTFFGAAGPANILTKINFGNSGEMFITYRKTKKNLIRNYFM